MPASYPSAADRDPKRQGDSGQGGGVFHRFPAGDLETRAALGAVCGRLRAAGLSEDDRSSAELILAEALNNIVEHAYGGESGEIELHVALHHDRLVCLIRDHGRPMPDGRPPDPGPPHIAPPDYLPEGGFGWHIIRCLTTDLHYRRAGDWNELSFHVPLGGLD